jgi:radical SAM protein with 4Fe4S-binding SPASM domain
MTSLRTTCGLAYSSYHDGLVAVDYMPLIYQIEPTSRCNLACRCCPRQELDSYIDMPMALFDSIVDQIAPYAYAVKLSYLGEPLLHPDIITMIQCLKQRTAAHVSLYTNATRLTHKLGVDLIRSGLDEIVFSLDGFDEETYSFNRRKARRSLVWRNIEDFLLLKLRRKPSATINCVRLANVTGEERNRLREYWAEYNCPVEFSPFVTWSGQLRNWQSLSSELKRSPIDKLARVPCAELWYKTLITADGEILVCCNDYKRTVYLGNVKNSTIANVWNGDAMVALRESHIAAEYSNAKICGHCNEWSDPTEMERLARGRAERLIRP